MQGPLRHILITLRVSKRGGRRGVLRESSVVGELISLPEWGSSVREFGS